MTPLRPANCPWCGKVPTMMNPTATLFHDNIVCVCGMSGPHGDSPSGNGNRTKLNQEQQASAVKKWNVIAERVAVARRYLLSISVDTGV